MTPASAPTMTVLAAFMQSVAASTPFLITNFSCAFNNLSSLSGCPKWVGGDFFCHGNKLEELNGPEFVDGDFIIDKSIVNLLDERYEINNDFEYPRVTNYNNVNKLIKRSNNINSILKNNI